VPVDGQITVLVPTSPIKSHPSTEIIEKCIASVRLHLATAKIIIMADGVRPEQKDYEERYVDYLTKLKTIAADWGDVSFSLFAHFSHQAHMTRETLKAVHTPLILFLESDTFFIRDAPIDFAGICRVIRSGALHMVEFHCHWEPWTLPAHDHLMLDKDRHFIDGVPFVRTWQWSQRPHVASTHFYRMILKAYFTQDCRTFIEDRMHDVMASSKKSLGDDGWHLWKLAYYAPLGSIRRTWTDDGRAGDSKFEGTYVF
jgi:hypothetical protein